MEKMNLTNVRSDRHTEHKNFDSTPLDCENACPRNRVAYSINMNSVNVDIGDLTDGWTHYFDENISLSGVEISASFEKMIVQEIR